MTRHFFAILTLLTLAAPCVAVAPQYTFGRHDFPTGSYPSAADVTGDGKEDLIVANPLDNTVSVFLDESNRHLCGR
ncbi:MAG TPA: FG-GAP repeat protein [Terriglobales bacterium]